MLLMEVHMICGTAFVSVTRSVSLIVIPMSTRKGYILLFSVILLSMFWYSLYNRLPFVQCSTSVKPSSSSWAPT